MIRRLKPKSEFSRNVLTLMTGTTIAQAIPIAMSPILTRLYSPDEFGVFALFISITSIFSSIATGRYELAIMLQEKDDDALNIFILGFLITVFLSVSLLFLVLIFGGFIANLLNNNELSTWLYFIPIVVFFSGLFNLHNYYNNRLKRYINLSYANIQRSIVLVLVQTSSGFLHISGGLIIGQITSLFFVNIYLFRRLMVDKIFSYRINSKNIINLAKRYKNFPKFSMPAVLLNVLSQQLINIFMPTIFSLSTLGFYSLVQRVLSVPSMLIGGSVAQVFFNVAQKEKEETGKAIMAFRSTLMKLILVSVPIFIILFLIIEDVFTIAFGAEWAIAGDYAKILIPLFFIRFISSSLSLILPVFEKLRSELLINIILITTSLFLVLTNNNFILFLIKFSIFMSINYFFFLCYYYKLAKYG